MVYLMIKRLNEKIRSIPSNKLLAVVIGLAVITVAGFAWIDSIKYPITSSEEKNLIEKTVERDDLYGVAECTRTEGFIFSDSVTRVMELINDRSLAYLDEVGLGVEAFDQVGTESEAINAIQQLIKNPVGRYVYGLERHGNCFDIRFVDKSKLPRGVSAMADFNKVPDRATILLDNYFEDDPSIASLLLAPYLSEAISYYQAPLEEHKTTNQCLTNKAHGLALQLSYLVISIGNPNEEQSPDRIEATVKINEEINQLSQAFMKIVAVGGFNFNFYEYRGMAEDYVRSSQWYVEQCSSQLS